MKSDFTLLQVLHSREFWSLLTQETFAYLLSNGINDVYRLVNSGTYYFSIIVICYLLFCYVVRYNSLQVFASSYMGSFSLCKKEKALFAYSN